MNSLKTITIITTGIVLILSIFSLLYQDIYSERFNQITLYELKGQDLMTAIISGAFLLIIFILNINDLKTKIIWLGCLLYIFYIYAYFSLGGITSIFYLVYILITGLSFFLIILLLIDIIRNKQSPIVKESYPRIPISIFLFIAISIMTIIEIQEIAQKTIINQEKLNPFFVFYVLDLGFVFPVIIISAILNLKKNKWGYLLTGIALIKIVTILPAVIFNDLFHWLATDKFIDLSFDIIALIITVTAILFLYLFLKTISVKEDIFEKI